MIINQVGGGGADVEVKSSNQVVTIRNEYTYSSATNKSAPHYSGFHWGKVRMNIKTIHADGILSVAMTTDSQTEVSNGTMNSAFKLARAYAQDIVDKTIPTKITDESFAKVFLDAGFKVGDAVSGDISVCIGGGNGIYPFQDWLSGQRPGEINSTYTGKLATTGLTDIVCGEFTVPGDVNIGSRNHNESSLKGYTEFYIMSAQASKFV